MDLYRYFEAKEQNKRTAGMIRALAKDGRAKELPNWIGSHYRKMDPETGSKLYQARNYYDRPVMDLLQCSNTLEVQMAYNGDTKIIKPMITCHHPQYCACCGTRQARTVASQLRYKFYLNKDKGYSYYMLTLTLPNSFDGFRGQFAIYNKVLRELLQFIGFRRGASNNICTGAFGAKELTYSYDKGFHPHMHLIVAFDSSRIVDQSLTRKGFVKGIVFDTGRVLDGFAIRDKFVDLIKRDFAEYYEKSIKDVKSLNIGFEPISNIDTACEEVCKYLCDYNSFTSKHKKDKKNNDSDKNLNAFFIFLRDCYGVKKYSKIGCFSWGEDLEADWKQWVENGRPTEENAHFIQFIRSLHSRDLIYFGQRKGLDRDGCVVTVPCFYPREQLFYGGSTVYLRYVRNGCFVTELFDPFIPGFNKLKTVQISKSDADHILNWPRDDISQLYEMIRCFHVK